MSLDDKSQPQRYRAYANGGFFKHPEGEWVMHSDLSVPSPLDAQFKETK